VPETWPTAPGERPPLVASSPVPWPPGRAQVLDRPAGSAGPPDGPDGPPNAGRRPPWGWVAAVSVLSILLLGALLWPRSTENGKPTPTTGARPSTTAAPGPSAPSPPPRGNTPGSTPASPAAPPTTAPAGPPPSVAEVQAAIDQLLPFAQAQRGQSLTSRPAVAVMDSAAFDEQVRAQLDRHQTLLQRQSQLLQVLGVVDPSMDAAALLRDRAPLGIVARYDPNAKMIVVRGQPLTPYTREQLVAALVAAIDDQHFGTDRPALDDAGAEARAAFDALVAGDAVRIADAWVNTLNPADKAARDRAEEALGGADLSRLRPALAALIQFPTDAGSAFATALAGAGPGVLDGAFAAPPAATADILHPDRYRSKVAPVVVPAPTVQGKVLATATFGELMTAATLADTLGPDAAGQAASAWAGDTYVLYDGRSGPCVHIDFRAASPAGLDQLHAAWDQWKERHEGTEVTVAGETLQVNRCVSARGGRSVL
jgi:hypothetical protein